MITNPQVRIQPSWLARTLVVTRYTLYRQRHAPLVWGLSLGALCALVVVIFPSIEGTKELSKLVENYPRALREAFGFSGGTLNTIQGYLTAEVFSFIGPLALAFFPIRAMGGATVGAEESGALDVLLGTPLSRRQLVVGTFVGTAISLLAILLVIGLCTWLVTLPVGVDLPIGDLAAGLLNIWPLSLFFGSVATLAAASMRRSSRVYAVSTFLLVAMYLIDVLGKLSDPIEPFRAISAFRYYGSALEHGIDWGSFTTLSLMTLVLAALAAYLFQRRDIRG